MSFTPAKAIVSSQKVAHKDLDVIVKKHLKHPYKKPIASHTINAFNQFEERWLSMGQPALILDSACGTGASTRFFSQKYSQHLVVGLDQSEKRLQHSDNQESSKNCLLLRCDCTDFWRLAEERSIKFEQHYLLYPNPYPKSKHLKRRWHGHPAFSSLIAISARIELRTNWKVYAEEFLSALDLAGLCSSMSEYGGQPAITAFERKYQKSGHNLWVINFSE